jgi:uncharacterized protein YidB (DUF937 family)
MGLLDSLIGNLGGSSASSRAPTSSSVSPVVKAILLLLAAKAAQSMTSRSSAQTGNAPGPASGQSSGLGGVLPGGLGGALGGGALGGLLGGLVEQLRGRGFGDQVDSWIGAGQNKHIAPQDMARALGPDAINELEQHTGLPRDQLLDELSHELPDSIDHVTPGGRLPSDDEIWSGPSR